MSQQRFKLYSIIALLGVRLTLDAGCSTAPEMPPARAYEWEVPAHFPEPVVPTDNPMSAEKVELGRYLFYDRRLSLNGRQSCGSCHIQALAFTDGLPHAVGSTGEIHPRGSMSLTNVAYAARLAWANPLVDTLEAQALLPLLGETPVELGMAGQTEILIDRIASDPYYVDAFEAAWPEDGSITLNHIVQAIASFERTLISGESRYDSYIQGDESALTSQEKQGLELFMSEKLECFHCHGSFNFTDSLDHSGLPTAQVAFHNTGLYDLDGAGRYPTDNTGIYSITGDASDMGRFKAPTLRNISVTAPYMHDGSVATLEDAIDHYARGGRRQGLPGSTTGPNLLKSEFVSGFVLSPGEKEALIAFLKSLTDETFLTDPRFSDPFADSP